GALFGSFAESTHVVKRHLKPMQRTYSLPHPYAVSTEPVRDVDAVNWTALAGMEDANGYESLILSRYSRAFRGEVDTEPFIAPDWTLLGLKSQVLDLLGVAYVVAFQNFASVPGFVVEKDGVIFSLNDFAQDLKVDRPFTLPASGTEADSLILVTTLGVAGYVEQGNSVTRISIHTADGRIVERDLLAGIHTAEMTYDRPDVKAVVRHQRAPIFDSGPGDPARSFQNHRYLARIDLEERLRVTQVDFRKTASDAGVGLWKVTLHDSVSGKSWPLAQPPLERWETIYDKGNVVVLKNLRAMPRAWMVTKVATLDDAELLRVIRGESDLTFDPRTTAYLEAGNRSEAADQAFVQRAAAPATPPQVRILSYQPARLRFETASTVPALLVIGEIHYPGWEATIDGAAATIHRTNFLLRGVFVPAGRHTVEMRYRAPGLRNGALVSLATLLLIGFGSRSKRLRAM
ncbi:MAG TPA: YfhO family protein, partial [Thermoanaerobaculia bacterium]|nr:YfhO family protein [Thermoanaerobaculia bacterium]